ncbi:LEM-3-like GIY-YIG domain-containing protein [Brucella anthropi]|uniref:LEM-3-like GIY-YIG domain-containing protein n=1 Tax=Brucella anthropi TaxID=529 RepID=UPI003D96A4BE
MMRFSEEVCEKLGNYVYRLIDPRNGETFYVGKGKGNRVFDHAAGVAAGDGDGDQILGAKLDRIRAIKNAGLSVTHVIHRHEIPDEAIFEVEAALIDAYHGLTNIQGGHASTDRGPMNHIELIDKYSLPEFPTEPTDSLVLICINKLEERFNRKAMYDLVRYCWRINRSRAENATYVIAVVRGVAVGVFSPEVWLPATLENFSDVPHASDAEGHRFGFIGKEAPDSVWELYVGSRGKQITNPELKHVQNPVRFWKC